MEIRQIPVGTMKNFSYLIIDSSSNAAAAIDPAFDPDKICRQADEAGAKITCILITHGHFDHVNGLSGVIRRFDPDVYIGEEEISSIREISAQPLSEGDEIQVGSITIRAIATPGHTPGARCFLAGNNLFTGDTLFIGGCGRTDLGDGDTKDLWDSLKRIKELPPNTIIWPGHHYGILANDTLKNQMENNWCLKALTFDEFRARRDK